MSIRIACCISGNPCPRIVEHLTHLAKYKQQMDFFIFFWDVIDSVSKRQINMILQPKEIIYRVPINFPFDAKYKEPDKTSSKNNFMGYHKRNNYGNHMKIRLVDITT
jgi:hypothetical protein